MTATRARDGRPSRTVRERTVIALKKVIDVRAPLPGVFAACGRIERLPELLPHLRETPPVAGDHHHWMKALNLLPWAKL